MLDFRWLDLSINPLLTVVALALLIPSFPLGVAVGQGKEPFTLKKGFTRLLVAYGFLAALSLVVSGLSIARVSSSWRVWASFGVSGFYFTVCILSIVHYQHGTLPPSSRSG